MMSGSHAFIYDAVRTPRGKGKPQGALHALSPPELAALPLRALDKRHGLEGRVDDVVLGCVESINDQGGNIARAAVFAAAFHYETPGLQLNRFCGSGLEAISIGAAKIVSGAAEAVIAGGVEMMSHAPIFAEGGALGADPRLSAAARFIPQGVSADVIASLNRFTRNDLDAYAALSHRRAAAAQSSGYFRKSLVPVTLPGNDTVIDADESVRPETDVSTLASLKPAFQSLGERGGYDAIAMQVYPHLEQISHHHHSGNSSGIADGAAALLLGSRGLGERLGKKPRAKFVSFRAIGSEPCAMLTGTVDASAKALSACGMTRADVDLVECNEAFAAVVLDFAHRGGFDLDRVNVNGGAIAFGHPLGATGAMLVNTALDELERAGKSTALITLCVGVGMAVAAVIERV